MILVIDNYDSFTYNLVQYLGELGADLIVRRNDAVDPLEIRALAPSHIVISPGPGTPADGGVSLQVIDEFYTSTPILGVCLGHQCIAAAFGGRVGRAPRLMHGKTSAVYHGYGGILAGVPSPFTAARYHSLVVYEPLPACLEVTATTAEGEVMALRHKEAPLVGLQFHPESILTEYGKQILANFLAMQPRHVEQPQGARNKLAITPRLPGRPRHAERPQGAKSLAGAAGRRLLRATRDSSSLANGARSSE
jgi:anthranilate synthase/aminodeoxychorismate synthase-like glutamine amidotransferase